MSREQRELVDQLMRGNPFDLGGDVATQRPLLEALLTAHPVAADVVTTEVIAGDRAAILIEVPPVTSPGLLLFFHGGGFAFGSAASSVGLAADLARAAGMRCLTVEYRLAPEHPYPAALDDALSAYRSVLADSAGAPIAVAGESAGGNLAAAMLLRARADGLPMPAALVLMSPLADLAASSQTYESRADRDPKLTQASIRARVKDYANDARLDDPLLSPSRADLTGFPSTLIQVGSNEVLLGDALQLANRAAHDDVDVTLQVTSGVPHVFQAFAAILDEGSEALQLAGTFLRRHVQQDAAMTR